VEEGKVIMIPLKGNGNGSNGNEDLLQKENKVAAK